MEKYYKVSESELRELIHDSMKLCALAKEYNKINKILDMS